MSNMPTTHPDSDPSGAAAIEKLHKMSRTAGLGATEYVAVNVPAVAAMFFGLASALVTVDLVIFCIMPLVAITLAIIAIYQIRGSNGTQTGTFLAAGGLLLALAFTGYTGSLRYAEYASTRADTQAIEALSTEFGTHLSQKDYAKSYALMSQSFIDRVPVDRFNKVWTTLESDKQEAAVINVETSHLFEFRTADGQRVAAGQLLVKFKVDPQHPARLDTLFRHSGGKWYIDDIKNVFPATQPAAAGPREPMPQ